MSAERREVIENIVTETLDFLPPDNQVFELKGPVNDNALQVIVNLDQLLTSEGERKEVGLRIFEPPYFTPVYSTENPNLIGVIIVGAERDHTYPENIKVHRQVVIIDHDPNEVENSKEFASALQERKVAIIGLELGDDQDASVEKIGIDDGRINVIVLSGKIIDWTPTWGAQKLPGMD